MKCKEGKEKGHNGRKSIEEKYNRKKRARRQ